VSGDLGAPATTAIARYPATKIPRHHLARTDVRSDTLWVTTTSTAIFCAVLLPKLLPLGRGRILASSPAGYEQTFRDRLPIAD